MATNLELVAQAKELAEAQGLPPLEGIDDMVSKDLLAIVKGLKASSPEGLAKAEEFAASQATKPKGGYVVAEGRNLVCLKGALAQGDSITVDMLSGGQEPFDNLVKLKYIVKA